MQHQPFGFYNRDGECLQRGTNCVLIYNSYVLDYTVRLAAANVDFSFEEQLFQFQTILLAGGPV